MRRKSLLRILGVLYLLLFVGSVVWAGNAWAASKADVSIEDVKGVSTQPTPLPTPTLTSYASLDTTQLPPIYAKEYALYDVESGQTLAQGKDLSPVAIASTTKVMTTYLASHYLHPTDIITISSAVTSQPSESSLMGLHTGEHISVEQLLYGALLVSGNDAAYALAEQTGALLLGNPTATSDAKIARFVKEMNTQADYFHMTGTHYLDPVGINDGGHSNATDLAKLASQVISDSEIKTVIGTPAITFTSLSGYSYSLVNSNRLVTDYQYPGVIGGKTGFTDAAGHCLINVAQRNGHTLVAVILHTNASTNDASAIESRKLLDAGFNLIQWN